MNQNEKDIEEQLLLHYLLGTITPDDKALVDEWLCSSKVHRQQLDRLEALWLETGKLTPPPVAVDVDAAWNRISGRMKEEAEKSERMRQQEKIIPMPVLRWIIGAAAILILGLGFWWLSGTLSPEPIRVTLTASGGLLRDTLPDGSRIVLNTGSTLVYQQQVDGRLRMVTLTGEAFFDVQPDSALPFEVHTDIARISVTGTSFTIKAYPESDVEVSVHTGTVTLSGMGKTGSDMRELSLYPGMKGILARDAPVPVAVPDTMPDRLFWLHHTLEFRQTPLRDVFDLLRLHYRITVVAESPELLSCRLTATFRDEPPETILQIIAGSFGLVVEQKDQRYLLKGKGCHE